MTTQPMNQYITPAGLTDLAQFAIPDRHDLWPEIERAARRSAAAMPTSRPGILSLGISGAWTVVGILLIAATFTILGFGLAMLALLNSERSVPATQPEATATPAASAPSVSANAIPTVGATRPSSIRDMERTALVAIYNATGGEDWNTSDGWLSDSPLDQWQRVTADQSGRVTDLDLSANLLIGEIPAGLGNFPRLKLLYINDNKLTGVLPHSLTGISGLASFHFHNNLGLCAPVDEAFQTWLRGITEVRGSSCAPEDSSEDQEVLAELFSALNGENWTNNTNWLTERPVREWYGVTNDASGRVIGLELEWNGLNGEIPTELGGLTNLKRLELGNNRLTGEIPRELGNLSNLETLLLHSNRLTGEIPTELVHLSNLEALVLSSNRLTGTIPTELVSLTNLKALALGPNQLTGEIPTELGNLSNLVILLLGNNRLTGEIPGNLGSLYNLGTLDLTNNFLSGKIPTEFGNLSNLSRLSLGENQLTGEIPKELGSLPNLNSLVLGGNQFIGCVPAKLREVPNSDLSSSGMSFC